MSDGIYRDRMEQCPRCHVDLVTAGSVRSCPECAGHWVRADVLREMMETMLVPPRPAEIDLVADRHPRLACPSCEQAMETWALHRVPIDRCERHGLWFDRAELETVLFAATGLERPEAAPVLRPESAAVSGELEALGEVLKRS